MKSGQAAAKLWSRFSRSVWLFPALLVIPLIIMTAFKISGSSIGIYSMINGVDDPNALTHNYRGVRSDEWVVSTQMTVAQAQNQFRRINQNIGNGQDMSLMGDVPYKDWSAVFKPQNLVFSVLPLEYAFAFRWWSVGLVLVVAAYFFALQFYPGRRLRAALLASLIGLSPLLFWWYTPSTFMCVSYCLIGLLLAMRIISITAMKARIIYSLLLAFVLACFALILYPPFQIACAVPSAFFFGGWLLEHYSRDKRREIIKGLGYIVAAGALAGVIVLAFLQTRSSAVSTVTHTVYPGTRVEISGGIDPLLTFSSFLSPNLQYETQASVGYLRNQSEASNFILIAPFLLLPSLYLIYRHRKQTGKLLWSLALVDVAIVFTLARMHFRTPWLDPFYNLFLQSKVPPTRMLIGLGLAGFFQLILIIKALDGDHVSRIIRERLAWIAAGSGLVVMVFVGFYTIARYTVFISNPMKVLVFALWISAGVYFIVRRPVNLGLGLLVLFSVVSVYRILPYYRGLGPFTTSPLVAAIKSTPNDGNWVSVDNRLIINFPIMAGKHSLNSVQFYPQLAQWHQIDPSGQYDTDYNRYAHVEFDDDKNLQTPFDLPQADVLLVKFDPCGSFLQRNDKYVLSSKPLTDNCLQLDRTIDLPAQDYYIYQITPAASSH